MPEVIDIQLIREIFGPATQVEVSPDGSIIIIKLTEAEIEHIEEQFGQSLSRG